MKDFYGAIDAVIKENMVGQEGEFLNAYIPIYNVEEMQDITRICDELGIVHVDPNPNIRYCEAIGFNMAVTISSCSSYLPGRYKSTQAFYVDEPFLKRQGLSPVAVEEISSPSEDVTESDYEIRFLI